MAGFVHEYRRSGEPGAKDLNPTLLLSRTGELSALNLRLDTSLRLLRGSTWEAGDSPLDSVSGTEYELAPTGRNRFCAAAVASTSK